jgi:CHAT domain-containing protein
MRTRSSGPRFSSAGTGDDGVHFTLPLNSALALTVPEDAVDGQDNGLLQAWEIVDSVRLDVDLVTLSACNTALGKEMGGEGLLGLTRAFQYAGARSVLASLWNVADRSTADLMKRFYSKLKSGPIEGGSAAVGADRNAQGTLRAPVSLGRVSAQRGLEVTLA